MTQGWNRQIQNIQRLIDEYAKAINLRDQGFQLGESGDLRRPGNFTMGETGPMKTGKTVPTVYQQPKVQPQPALPGRNTISLPTSQKPLLLTTSGKPLPNQSSVINLGGDAGQMAYKLPDGTYTSNQNLANIAKTQTARAKDLAVKRPALGGLKAGGIAGAITTPIAILSHKDAYKYYNDMVNDKSLPGEWRQIANALRLKEAISMGVEGPGATIGTSLGAILGKGNKWAMTAGGLAPEILGRSAGAMADSLLQPAIDKYNFPVYSGGKKDNSNSTKGGNNNGAGSSVNAGNKGTRGVDGQPNTQAQALALAQQLGANPPGAQQTEGEGQRSNLDAINDYISKLQGVNQPYIDALTAYYNNYPKMLDQQQRAARYWQGISSITGNPRWAQIANYYNPIQNEANRLSTLKTLQDAQAGDLNAINEMMGNLAMAEEMGLPPEAAFANKNLLTMMAAKDREANRYQIAVENNLMKKYGIDRNYARALAVQDMRGKNALDVANIYTGAYGGGVAPGLNRQGGVQTPYQPLANKQQGGSNLQQAFDKYGN